ncbi:MAG: response regulator transcription factor [Planctomycetes bacterium]|nr:response regulator transcription factor [Planctomycetota bacterium]
MPNVLIVDPADNSGAILKGFINTCYGASVSGDLTEALHKIETALFDAVVIDISGSAGAALKFISQARKILPALPIIGITDAKEPAGAITKTINHPVRAITIIRSLRDALKTDAETYHRELSATANISAGRGSDAAIRCSLTDLSLKGIIVEPGQPIPCKDNQKEEELFQSFFRKQWADKKSNLLAVIPIKGSNEVKLNGRIAFVEQDAAESIRRVGLGFSGLKSAEQAALKALLERAA